MTCLRLSRRKHHPALPRQQPLPAAQRLRHVAARAADTYIEREIAPLEADGVERPDGPTERRRFGLR